MDWGFNQFVPLVDVADPARGFIHNGGSLRLRVEVTVRKDERLSWDSRKETGYVGLKNQGATCYMNSLLQCLYHLPYFRKARGALLRGESVEGVGPCSGSGWHCAQQPGAFCQAAVRPP